MCVAPGEQVLAGIRRVAGPYTVTHPVSSLHATRATEIVRISDRKRVHHMPVHSNLVTHVGLVLTARAAPVDVATCSVWLATECIHRRLVYGRLGVEICVACV